MCTALVLKLCQVYTVWRLCVINVFSRIMNVSVIHGCLNFAGVEKVFGP